MGERDGFQTGAVYKRLDPDYTKCCGEMDFMQFGQILEYSFSNRINAFTNDDRCNGIS